MYPLGRFSTHPLRALRDDALGNKFGELCPWKYQGRTSTYMVLGIKVFCVIVGQVYLARIPWHIKLSYDDLICDQNIYLTSIDLDICFFIVSFVMHVAVMLL